MKKIFSLAILFMTCAIQVFAQYTTVQVSGEITSNTTWTNDKQYLLKGYVYVTSGNTLTIDKGTIIRGDKSTKGTLLIERGAKIMVNGTADMPVIFTSNQPEGSRTYGDWGGVILCGKSTVNWTAGEAQVEGGPRSMYGGTDPADNSGKISYCRIEFGGIAFSPNNEVNGLTLCGVGSGTQLDHIQVSMSGDDGYEFFGGTVNAKYLISHRSWDDDFDTDVSYSGNVQFFVVQRDPNVADNSGSKGFESDSYLAGTIDGKTNNNNATKAVFSNGTVIGPVVTPTSTAYDALQFIAGAHIRRGSSLSIMNTIIGGWPTGLLLDESSSSYGSTTANIGLGSMEFKSNIIAGTSTTSIPSGAPNKNVVYVKDGARSLTVTTTNADSATSGNTNFTPYTGPFGYINDPSSRNAQYASLTSNVRLTSPFDLTNPNFMPLNSSPVCYNGKALPAYVNTYYGGVDTFHNGKVYPFDPTKPINEDTSNFFKNYNAPTVVPNFTSNKTSGSFFDKVNYVGAFAGTGNPSDNWMAGWTNFDPNNTFYEYVVGINNVKTNIEAASVYPNPAVNNATVTVTLTEMSDLNITLVDFTGRKIQDIFSGKNVIGFNAYNVNLDGVASGLYFVNITSGNAQKSVKLSVNNK
ncbi:MAG: T9SS type A sorting domain-containing protein [Bacteroidetes bacterium]|nr:T9SS type A sorting domain-containing protein [Bacteroidota bacterium]